MRISFIGHRCKTRAYERGRQGGTMTPGTMDFGRLVGFGGPIIGPVGFRGPIEMTLRNQYVDDRRPFSFF